MTEEFNLSNEIHSFMIPSCKVKEFIFQIKQEIGFEVDEETYLRICKRINNKAGDGLI